MSTNWENEDFIASGGTLTCKPYYWWYGLVISSTFSTLFIGFAVALTSKLSLLGMAFLSFYLLVYNIFLSPYKVEITKSRMVKIFLRKKEVIEFKDVVAVRRFASAFSRDYIVISVASSMSTNSSSGLKTRLSGLEILSNYDLGVRILVKSVRELNPSAIIE